MTEKPAIKKAALAFQCGCVLAFAKVDFVKRFRK